jgi:hypothetical protein
LSFLLWELAKNRDVQGRLREEIVEKLGEIRSAGRGDFTADDYDSMPYLLAVVKVRQESPSVGSCSFPTPQENLRVHPAVSETQRAPKEDVVLPLTTPVIGISGKVYKELPVPAGTVMSLSLLGYNLYVSWTTVGITGVEIGFAVSQEQGPVGARRL